MAQVKQYPYRVLIFFNAAKDGEESAVLVDETVIAPDRDIAYLAAAYLVPQEYRSNVKLGQLDIRVDLV